MTRMQFALLSLLAFHHGRITVPKHTTKMRGQNVTFRSPEVTYVRTPKTGSCGCCHSPKVMQHGFHARALDAMLKQKWLTTQNEWEYSITPEGRLAISTLPKSKRRKLLCCTGQELLQSPVLKYLLSYLS
jgi:hypothetical protein